ncbi:MAG: branched-chain amino acid ABC transporter permease [Hyphomicrobiaceae bacterium]|nr:branched-chain amino acid ABC transporter permease [Hyphomicrobiaceae bacterium]
MTSVTEEKDREVATTAEPTARRVFTFNDYMMFGAILLFGILGPILFPNYTFQIAVLWLMVLFAQTWDVMGGQMGYNSLGNIFFFGAGMYICAVTQIGLFTDVGAYTSPSDPGTFNFTPDQYYIGVAVGLVFAAIGSALLAAVLGWIVFGLRGPYFAIGTLGIALAAGELIGAWEWVGAGSGFPIPVYPGSGDGKSLFYYALCFGAAIATFLFLKWLYSTRFGLAINAIRDDEEKAEAMGIHTMRHKTAAWMISAFFLGISGGLFGNMTGFIEPLEVAFPVATFGIFMVAMALLGGKGTIWGPVLGAILFHILKEATWIYFLGWQWVALGVIIIINIVFFQQGIVGWLQERYPHWFGIEVEARSPGAKEAAE